MSLDDFFAQRIEKIKTLIGAYDDALLALASGAQSYQLNTGQTTVMVTKGSIRWLQATRGSLLNELVTTEARICGSSVQVIPGC